MSVSRRNANTYVFKFNSVLDKSAILAKGTWYLKSRPMVVRGWGSIVSNEPVKSVPIWIKLTNAPDTYWMREGLGILRVLLVSHLVQIHKPRS